MSTRRTLAVVVALGITVACLMGAGGATARPIEDVTLRMLMPTTFQFAQEIANKNFERVYPHIHIEAQYLPSDQLATLILTQFQAGNAPDLLYTRPGRTRPSSTLPLAEAGKLLDLTGRKWQPRIYGPVKSSVTVNGRVYGWPMVVSTTGALYNVDLFKQLGLKVPTRFSDVLAMCSRITAAGKVPFVQAFSSVTSGQIIGRQRFANDVYGVDPKWDAKHDKKQVSFSSSPLWRRSLQTLVDMKNASCFQPGSTGTSRPQQYAMFARGDAVMSIINATEIPNFANLNPSLKYAMFNVPSDNPGNSRVLVSCTVALAGNKDTKYPNEVRTYIDFIAREQQSSLYARLSGGVSPLDMKKGILPAYMKASLGPMIKAGQFDADRDGTWPKSGVFDEAYAAGIIGLMTGQLSIDDILSNMDRLWNS